MDWGTVPPLLTVMLAPLVAVAGGMWAITQWGLGRFAERIDARFDAVDARFDAVDARFDAVDARFDAVDHRFDSVNGRIDAVDKRCDGIETHLKELRPEIRADLRALSDRIDRLNP